MGDVAVRLVLNGEVREDVVEPRLTLADFVRERLPADGDAPRVRARRVRRVHRARRWRSCALLSDVRGPGERVRGDDRRGVGFTRWSSEPGAAGVPRCSTACSAGSARRASSCRSPRFLRDNAEPTDEQIREALSGQPLPLHRATKGSSTRCGSRPIGRGRRDRRTPTSTSSGAARFVGQRVRRHEDARLLTGRGAYVDDIVLPGTLHAAFVRSDFARGTHHIASTRRRLRDMPGVVAVFTASISTRLVREWWVDFEGPDGAARPFRLLAEDDVRFVGEPIAMVVADARYRAEDAAEAVDDRCRAADPPSSTSSARSMTTRRSVHPDRESNLVLDHARDRYRRCRGGLRFGSARVFTETFRQHRYTSVPMETRGIAGQLGPVSPRARRYGSRRRGRTTCGGLLARVTGHRRAAGSASSCRTSAVASGRRCGLAREELAVVFATPSARPAGEVDRGPPREPASRRARPRGPRNGELGGRRGRHHPRRASSTTSRTAGVVPGGGEQRRAVRPPLLFPGPYRIPSVLRLWSDRLHEHGGRGAVPRARGCSRRSRASR